MELVQVSLVAISYPYYHLMSVDAYRSWLTTTTMELVQVSLVAISRLSHITASMLRWLVGSSNRSTSGLAKRAAARAVRTRQPPLSACPHHIIGSNSSHNPMVSMQPRVNKVIKSGNTPK
eukprot:1191465-Prorocentrum_minimum.AAC.1